MKYRPVALRSRSSLGPLGLKGSKESRAIVASLAHREAMASRSSGQLVHQAVMARASSVPLGLPAATDVTAATGWLASPSSVPLAPLDLRASPEATAVMVSRSKEIVAPLAPPVLKASQGRTLRMFRYRARKESLVQLVRQEARWLGRKVSRESQARQELTHRSLVRPVPLAHRAVR